MALESSDLHVESPLGSDWLYDLESLYPSDLKFPQL